MSRPRGRALGRGLEALIPIAPEGAESTHGIPMYVEVDQVRPSSEQVRRQFPAAPLRELADSIRDHGVLQPILVRRLPDGYELIAGERRWRAARLAGLTHVPAIVRRDAESEQRLLLGLIENLQRADLDPIEEARGVQRLIEQFGLTHEQAAGRLGRNRVSVTNALRLLTACSAVISATSAGAITAGHARALAGLEHGTQERGLKVVVARRLSVRQTERWAREQVPVRPGRGARAAVPDPDRRARSAVAAQERRLRDRYGDAAAVAGTRRSGRLMVPYESLEDLEELLRRLLD